MEVKSLFEIINDEVKENQDIVGNGILNENSLLLIVGRPKSGKSFLAMNFGLAISSGIDFAGFNIKKAEKVLLLSAEGGYLSNRRRLIAMKQKINECEFNEFYMSTLSYFPINEQSNYKSLYDYINKEKPKVLIIDPFIKFHNVDENTSSQIMEILGKIRFLIEKFSLSVILVHHSGKNESRGGRGSNAIEGEYDSSITIKRSKGSNNAQLYFDLRHEESPNSRKVYFNSKTNWYESIKKSVVTELLIKNGEMKKKDIVHYLLINNKTPQSTSYKIIKEEEENGLIIFNQEFKTLTSTSPVEFEK